MEYGTAGRYYIVDCGLMDTDPMPYPEVSREELAQTDYLFLTHCHKDHSGAFEYFIGHGFCGWLVASEMTLRLSGIAYEKTVVLEPDEKYREAESLRLPQPVSPKVHSGSLRIQYGRSGHCPGGLWFLIHDYKGTCFFSGDYQEDPLFYACDPVRNREAQLAVIDCAHHNTELSAAPLRNQLLKQMEEKRKEGTPIILTVPKYGRGMELLYMLSRGFPRARIKVDSGFIKYAGEMLTESWWYQAEPLAWLQSGACLEKEHILEIGGEMVQVSEFDYDFLLIADTHLKKEENASYVKAAAAVGAFLFVTGRVRAGSLPEELLKTGQALRVLYPHHQSRGDFARVAEENYFAVMVPFHNESTGFMLR